MQHLVRIMVSKLIVQAFFDFDRLDLHLAVVRFSRFAAATDRCRDEGTLLRQFVREFVQ
ncbi:hypothetical protein D3C81_1251610 [compost metagenome]